MPPVAFAGPTVRSLLHLLGMASSDPNVKWRGILGGLEETKGAPRESQRPRSPSNIVRVRPVGDGFAVFGHADERLSEILCSRDEAVREGARIAGADGLVLVEGDTGHVIGEVVHQHGRR